MGTHCYVGYEDEDGNVTYSYVHYDGYPDGIGKVLMEMTPEEIIEAVDGGQMRCISVVPPHRPEYLSGNEGCETADCIEDYESEIEGNVPYGYLLDTLGDLLVYYGCGNIEHGDDWQDLGTVLGVRPYKARARVQHTSEPGTVGTTGGNHPMRRTNEVIGFRVVNITSGEFIHNDGEHAYNYPSTKEPEPISRGDAFRRLGAYLDENPAQEHSNFRVEPVYRMTTPIEDAAHELGGLFESLCQRHGLDLGLSRQQIDAILAKDLEQVKNLGFTVGIPGRK